ncbi:MAG: restriction endonuclease, partial [Candidatus Heimdallarchaeota archaeon]|nr:restriction endonuclease [Candidatus Heimdallarchaeota archaeon]
MTIPKFDELFTSFLNFIQDKNEYQINEIVNHLADEFNLSEKDKKMRYKESGRLIFKNKVAWARLHLIKAGFIKATKRGYVEITPKGQEIIKKNKKIDRQIVEDNFEEQEEMKVGLEEKEEVTEKTPDELFRTNFEKIQQKLANELLEMIKNSSPDFFEKLVVDLLLKMGYGGTKEDAGKRIGGTNDEGIDGVIQEDRLGFSNIYIQAKKWENKVSRPELQKFVGALRDKNSQKGIFITTSNFTANAIQTAKKNNVVTINGDQLTRLMIEFNVGTTVNEKYEIKSIDKDYFD